MERFNRTPNISMGNGPHGGVLYASHCQFSWPVNAFLKVLGILKPFFQEGFKRGQGQSPSFSSYPINSNPLMKGASHDPRQALQP